MEHIALKPQSFFHFSLRELLLMVTAASALLALAVKSYPSGPTSFFGKFDPGAELQKVFQDLGIKTGSSMGGGGGSASPGERRRTWEFASRQNQIPLGRIGAEFAERVEAALKRSGCKLRGSSTYVGRDGLSGFRYSYQHGATGGEIFTEFVDLGEGNFRILGFCYEFTRR